MALAAVGVKTQIWNNQIKSAFLLLGFPFLLLLMVYSFFALVGLYALNEPSKAGYIIKWFGTESMTPWQAGLYGVKRYSVYALGVAIVWYLIALLCYQDILNGCTGARKINRIENERLYNLLENLCISRGLTIPNLYVIETNGLNAFATGISPKSYSITVTRGLLEKLDDIELEAVLAHELTHIINEDVSLMMIGIIFTGMLSLIFDIAYWKKSNNYYEGKGYDSVGSGYGRRGANIGGSGIAVVMFIGILVMFVGRMFSIALKLALSRKREFLADAGAVELTKNPDALISALKKISQNPGLYSVPKNIKEMCIIEPQEALDSMFFTKSSTHPSTEERIEALTIMGGRLT